MRRFLVGGDARTKIGERLGAAAAFRDGICYALVNRNKSLQDVYLDALPRPDSIDPDKFSVPEKTQQRIRDIVNRRDRARVKKELDRALAIYHPTREDSAGFAKAFQTWANKGVNAYRQSRERASLRGWGNRILDAQVSEALPTACAVLCELLQLPGKS